MTFQQSRVSAGRPIVLQKGDGQTIPGPEGITLKATGKETGGSIGFFEATSQPGFGPPRHIHHSNDELFYVLSGEFRFLIGEKSVDARPGSFVFIPRGTVHALKVLGSKPGKLLSAFIPGGQEQVFAEYAQLESTTEDYFGLTMDQMQAIAMKYDSEFVGPPL